MNILDDNSENVLLEKIPFGKIFMYGIGIPIGLTFLIFYYLFDGEIKFLPLDINIFQYNIGVSEISILIPILMVLTIFSIFNTWDKNVPCSRNLKIGVQILISFFVISLVVFALFGDIYIELWDELAPFSSLPDHYFPNYNLTLPIKFRRVIFLISLFGIFSLWKTSKIESK